MTEAIVDLAAFRANIGHDTQMEAMLLKLFIQCSEEILCELRAGYENMSEARWIEQMHLLKGTALNVAAYPMAAMAESAQHGPINRAETLDALEKNYACIKQVIVDRLANI